MSIPHLPCPVLGVAASGRSLAIVCLDHRLRLLDLRVHDLRHHGTPAAKLVATRSAVLRSIRELTPQSIVLEDGAQSVVQALVVSVVRGCAAETGLAFAAGRLGDACLRFTGAPSAARAVTVLRFRYEALATRFPEHPEIAFQDHERYRRMRPLIAALAIGHAAVLDQVASRG